MVDQYGPLEMCVGGCGGVREDFQWDKVYSPYDPSKEYSTSAPRSGARSSSEFSLGLGFGAGSESGANRGPGLDAFASAVGFVAETFTPYGTFVDFYTATTPVDYAIAVAGIVPIGRAAIKGFKAGRRGWSWAKSALGLCSFREDMLVVTRRGLVPIGAVIPGVDEVLSRDEATGEIAWQPVLGQYSNFYEDTVYVSIRDLTTGLEQTIVSNRIHPFFAVRDVLEPLLISTERLAYSGDIPGGRWVDAQNLKPGDRLLTDVESWAEIVSVRMAPVELNAVNLSIAKFHTFFVAGGIEADGVWVHNSCNLKGSRNPVVKAAAAAGVQAHKAYNWGLGWVKEVTLPSGRRADAVNFGLKEVGELKPNNARAVSRGEKQVERYRQELENTYGGNWPGKIEKY